MKSVTTFARNKIAVACVSTLAAGSCAVAHAGSFQLHENDASAVGSAHANRAEAGAISAMFNNAAALAFAPKAESGKYFSLAMTPIAFKAKFVNEGSVSAVGTPMTGANGSGGTTSAVPAIYAAADLGSNLRLGMGITVPYALTTDWEPGWVGRYFALRSKLQTIDINPNLSFKINDNIALGLGFSAQQADVSLSRAIDFGTVCFAALGAQLGAAQGQATCSQALVTPQTRDGKVTVEGKDWSYGVNAGAMFQFADTRLGVSYRSAITHKISGTARYEKPTLPDALNAITLTPATTNGNATADLRLPAVATVSVYHQLNKQWALMGDVSHSTWSRFNEIRIRFANGAADSVSPQNYKNTTRVAFGASFQATPKLVLRGGVAFDPSPVRDELRSPLVPDNDRKWVAFGATFKPSSDMTVDLSYAHLFVNEPGSSLTVSGSGSLRGRYDSVGANIVSVQLNRTF